MGILQELMLITEARDPDLTYTPLAIKGKVERMTVTLEGKKSELMTKLAKGYKRVDTELARLQMKRNVLNRVTKEAVLSYFDAEDQIFTRVADTISLTATVSKLEKPNDKVDYESVIEKLIELMPELADQIAKLEAQFSTTPKPKSPTLTVKMDDKELAAYKKKMKKIGGGVEESFTTEGVADLWTAFKASTAKLLKSVLSWGRSFDKKLDAIRALLPTE